MLNRVSTRTNFSTRTEVWRDYMCTVEKNIIQNRDSYTVADLHGAFLHKCKAAGQPSDHRYVVAQNCTGLEELSDTKMTTSRWE